MPDFETVSVQEAKLRTTSGYRGQYVQEYAGYIQQLSPGMAGKLHPKEDEKLTTIRRRLVVTAQTLDATLVIKRSGEDVYFWTESSTEEQPKRRYTRRRRSQKETIMAVQPVIEPEE
jgi:hypothetical protein